MTADANVECLCLAVKSISIEPLCFCILNSYRDSGVHLETRVRLSEVFLKHVLEVLKPADKILQLREIGYVDAVALYKAPIGKKAY